MASKFHIFLATLVGVLLCSAAVAQVRDGSSSLRRSSGHARPASKAPEKSTLPAGTQFQAKLQSSTIQISPSGGITSGFAPLADSFSFESFSGVPGLGFDFPHLAAISGSLRNNSSHFGHNGRRGQGSFVPIFFSGYPYGYEDLGYDQPEQQQDQQTGQQSQVQPQIIVIQQPVPAQHDADSERHSGSLSGSESAPQAAVPIPDVGDFILVRRDGRILFASVFSVVGAQLHYVTREGIRHILAMSDLDADATRQMNEACGTTVQIHN